MILQITALFASNAEKEKRQINEFNFSFATAKICSKKRKINSSSLHFKFAICDLIKSFLLYFKIYQTKLE